MNTTKILLSGAQGRMGRAIQSVAKNHNCEISFPVDMGDDPSAMMPGCDVVIDFSKRRDATSG